MKLCSKMNVFALKTVIALKAWWHTLTQTSLKCSLLPFSVMDVIICHNFFVETLTLPFQQCLFIILEVLVKGVEKEIFHALMLK